jgi:hypothetical protein
MNTYLGKPCRWNESTCAWVPHCILVKYNQPLESNTSNDLPKGNSLRRWPEDGFVLFIRAGQNLWVLPLWEQLGDVGVQV